MPVPSATRERSAGRGVHSMMPRLGKTSSGALWIEADAGIDFIDSDETADLRTSIPWYSFTASTSWT